MSEKCFWCSVLSHLDSVKRLPNINGDGGSDGPGHKVYRTISCSVNLMPKDPSKIQLHEEHASPQNMLPLPPPSLLPDARLALHSFPTFFSSGPGIESWDSAVMDFPALYPHLSRDSRLLTSLPLFTRHTGKEAGSGCPKLCEILDSFCHILFSL